MIEQCMNSYRVWAQTLHVPCSFRCDICQWERALNTTEKIKWMCRTIILNKQAAAVAALYSCKILFNFHVWHFITHNCLQFSFSFVEHNAHVSVEFKELLAVPKLNVHCSMLNKGQSIVYEMHESIMDLRGFLELVSRDKDCMWIVHSNGCNGTIHLQSFFRL